MLHSGVNQVPESTPSLTGLTGFQEQSVQWWVEHSNNSNAILRLMMHACVHVLCVMQYGFIYNTLRSLVVENYGEKTWIEIW